MTTQGRSGMRLTVLADQQGNLIAGYITSSFMPGTGRGDDIPQATMVPQGGQVMHEVDLPRELLEQGQVDLEALAQYRLNLEAEPRLVRKD